MAPHFLCCLPIRLGAFVVALISLILGGLTAGVSWFALYADSHWDDLQYHLTTRQKIILICWGIAYTLFTLAALFGLIGVIIKRINYVRTFAAFLKVFLVVSIIFGILNIVFLFVDKDAGCDLGSESGGNCINGEGISRGGIIAIAIVVVVIPILIEAYAVWIISDCVKYLEDKEWNNGVQRSVGLYPFSQPYAAVPHNDNSYKA
ncbi:hypothetical protein Moror_1512 [Moniliophthora roreri MCA 2997]|uniref:Uncharacterized protein n=2 Tax=Moniliophthora roreri TaxID=221103 RepID=V2XMJ2_MONRO|nr:hypothetical protein Moror_1512 [Moniliophthora roreri MCA 2997]KAI3609629.1 hypothetical protein WG66_001198 [Moniliophthora roreri]